MSNNRISKLNLAGSNYQLKDEVLTGVVDACVTADVENNSLNLVSVAGGSIGENEARPYVRFEEQTLTANQKAQARLNLGMDPETLKAEILADFINATEVAL